MNTVCRIFTNKGAISAIARYVSYSFMPDSLWHGRGGGGGGYLGGPTHVRLAGRALGGRLGAGGVPVMQLPAPHVHQVVPPPAAVVVVLVRSEGAQVSTLLPGHSQQHNQFVCFIA